MMADTVAAARGVTATLVLEVNVGRSPGSSKAAERQVSSSRERAVAAAIALLRSSGRPFGPIKTESAAAVVPPGEVTFSRKVAGGSRD